MDGSISWADLECFLVVCAVERSPYWEILGGFLGGGGGWDVDDLVDEGG